MKATATLNGLRDAQNQFFDKFENYVYSLAHSQNASQLRALFVEMPDLLLHIALRTNPNSRGNGRWLSVPWAIFADKADLTDAARECLQMLREVNYVPDGHFYDRVCRDGSLSLLSGFCDIFEIDTSVRYDQVNACLLIYGAGNILMSDGLDRFKMLLDRASDVNAMTGWHDSPVLFRLFTGTTSCSSSDEDVAKCLQAINLMLTREASVDIKGFMNGRAHNEGKGEVLPLLHAVYWCDYTGRIAKDVLIKAELVCDANSRDASGRTAQEYRQFLIDTNAPK